MRRKMAAGNWKMNGSSAALSVISDLATAHADNSDTDIVICPPAPLLFRASEIARASAVTIGAQDCHSETAGAFTGDIAAPMIADAGATHVIVGHSERRDAYHESNSDVRGKTKAAWDAGLIAILCIGESAGDRAADNTLDIIAGQLSGSVPSGSTGDNLVVAYEPVWAIGTGAVATTAQIDEVHDFIRARLIQRLGDEVGNAIRLLYGGSVKPGNAAEIFQCGNVDGALVGGASLKAQDFTPIIQALVAS
ncbi:triose-phosphate isomerase [Pseudosulfitobacter sp. DSM 107133]|jgi:triosephosphate isomerase|uniref:triose-phosphate isomerase n=1 Tax=Pseudosulfitobacter sp. DSM 107133 TaxID=2883100 RepID=UPI000DF3AFE3|nr:triose-phosphate isomerase [Pseudosulfitobacter sp. DSM 107133]UOA26943.1 Triosephosphate isomerase [Pseudosulfitobacter sp. DSM 107133]